MLPTIKEAVTAVNDARNATAEMLSHAGSGSASAFRSAATSMDDLAGVTERGFTAASDLIDSCDPGTILHDIRRIVRRHPGTILLVASALAATLGYAAASSGKPARLRS